MPPSADAIATVTRAYLDCHPAERAKLEPLLAMLATELEPTSRTTLPAHVTCSAVVINRDREVLHIHHKATGLTLCPGGHGGEESDTTLMATALREVAEEAGVQPGALCLAPQLLDQPVDIDINDIDPNPARGEGAHQHYDFRFVFYLADPATPETALQEEEVTGCEWRPFDQVASPSLRAKLQSLGLDGRPEPVNASALIHDGAGRYLLHLRDAFDHIWAPGEFSLLGGGAEPGDGSLEGTLRRELAEEVPGLRLGEVERLRVEWTTGVDGLAVPIQIFAASWQGDPQTADLREGVLLHWFRPEDLHRLRLRDSTRRLIHDHHAALPGQVRPSVAEPAVVVLDGAGLSRTAPQEALECSGSAGEIEGWTTLSSVVAFRGDRVVLRRDEVRRADQSLGTYEYSELADGVRVVALDDRGRIALVEESVYVCGQRLLMCPGGGCEPGEAPLTAAHRELAEEAGIRAAEVEPLTTMWRMPAGARTQEHLYLAQDLTVGEHHRDASEADMDLRWVPLEEAVAMCGDGRITEAGTLAAVLLTVQRITRSSSAASTDEATNREQESI
ncbi:NUDIX domain-containing protein [Kitasatospora sp. A2-31]|uniref:NUDIX hydrolase n=1 Tax=Kitasatospora sp. A2-31 TaxID=2916414 RepID=UPI001EEE6555|nr:NUDIX domain-containing protein [Kitasatospora sp. A2-31]MCG6499228.1 NUDIX domain-containing protein [Kitasatospora sp. A2-31]